MAKQSVAESTPIAGEELTRGHKKKARTRQMLVEAALRIYARKSAWELALNELAAEAGVSHGTIYNYFRTKEDVLEAVGIAVAEQLSEEILTLSAGITSGAERLSVAVRSFILRTAENPDWASALIKVVRYSEAMRSGLSTYLRADLQSGLRQDEFIYPSEKIAVTVVVSITIGAMAAIVEGDREDDHDSKIARTILLAMGVAHEQAERISNMPMPKGWAAKAADL